MNLHALALVPAAVGLCCLAADRRRARAGEIWAAALMTVAMLDAAVTALVPVVWWVVALLVGAMALGATRGRGRPLSSGGVIVADRAMAVHSAAGMVSMAALLVAMPGGQATASAAHHHGGAPSVTAAVTVLAGAFVVGSAVLAARAHSRWDRAQYIAMGVSVGMMSLATVA